MENVCTYKWLYVINDYPFPGESCGRKNVKLKLQFSTLINSVETGNQLLSFQSPHLGHTWGSLKELQLAWLSPELVTALRAFSLCYRAEFFCCPQRGGITSLSLHEVLLHFFVFSMVVVALWMNAKPGGAECERQVLSWEVITQSSEIPSISYVLPGEHAAGMEIELPLGKAGGLSFGKFCSLGFLILL